MNLGKYRIERWENEISHFNEIIKDAQARKREVKALVKQYLSDVKIRRNIQFNRRMQKCVSEIKNGMTIKSAAKKYGYSMYSVEKHTPRIYEVKA